eukprot:GHVN01063228.1.p1 GENE.GHVN01063228.1~~GHVN01063228.1.p1  ORF type:complete len:124 (-),score=7.58 GHVN01063228.1:417-788(-)
MPPVKSPKSAPANPNGVIPPSSDVSEKDEINGSAMMLYQNQVQMLQSQINQLQLLQRHRIKMIHTRSKVESSSKTPKLDLPELKESSDLEEFAAWVLHLEQYMIRYNERDTRTRHGKQRFSGI